MAQRAAQPRAAADLLRARAGRAGALWVGWGASSSESAPPLRFFRLRLTDSQGRQIPLYRVGGEGGLLDSVRLEGGVVSGFDTGFGRGEILLGPASRADVVAVFRSDAAGVATMWTLDYQRQNRANRNGYSSLPTLPVAHFAVIGTASEPFKIAAGDPLLTHPAVDDPVEDLRDDVVSGHLLSRTPGTASQNIRLTQQPPSVPPSIDGAQGTHHHGTADYYAAPRNSTTRWGQLGDLLELSVTNATHSWDHPEFRDNVVVPARLKLVYRVRLDDRPLMDGTTSEVAADAGCFTATSSTTPARG